jgi:hypothetical protein
MALRHASKTLTPALSRGERELWRCLLLHLHDTAKTKEG